ncbi:MAG: 30S ribosomal protein S13 [Kiritimatiellae bacterium]|nr:30S ribosomal protein S13 [Kiritimatiellia bacterium]
MPRLMGIDIPDRKRIEYSLRYIHGIGPTRSKIVLEKAQIDPAKQANELTADEIRAIISAIQELGFNIEGDLRREVSQNVRRLISIGSYRGTRHRRGLPVRGQRTKTNARTRKGGKHTVGAVRDKAARNAMKAGK